LVTLWFAAVNGWRLLTVVLAAAAIHEMGHYFVLRAYHAPVLEVRMGLLGMVMKTDTRYLSYGKELLAVLAGPGANLLCAQVLSCLDCYDLTTFIGANVSLALFNLIPLRHLDGGKILYLLATWFLGPEEGERLVCTAGIIFGTVLAVSLGYIMWQTGGSLWLFPPTISFLTVVRQEWDKNRLRFE